ncbi:Tho complex subunit 7-domain-containing protein [Dendryphion nanum]|uniref:Tho complex subunit 7-domain-containing protein n=1 Tax=Dendryphion nanum TaxID=256645 RepID=A0A9P9IGF4_9PLEO|nr:Tho complex subunit 7-domain-containing protein [Dendryphion nanum]
MAPSGFELLSQGEEDALHNIARLLTIESRPYQRISTRLLKPEALDKRPHQLPSPPPDASAADEEAAARAAKQEKEIQDIRTWQNDINNEIALLDHAILRMEHTTNSNHDERERYAVEKNAITSKQQTVRDHIEELRAQLVDAKETLAVRKTYDELTEKITNSKMLKPRDEQSAAHAKLDEEIAELQQEVEISKNTWAERRTQFGRIEDEAKEMLRMIKDEKEEAERKEGMMKDGDDNDDGEGSIMRGVASQVGTPRPDAGGATPLHIGQADDNSSTLRVPHDRLAPLSRGTSAAPSPAPDTEMAESGAQDDDSSGIEEGEEEDDDGPPEEMDQS